MSSWTCVNHVGVHSMPGFFLCVFVSQQTFRFRYRTNLLRCDEKNEIRLQHQRLTAKQTTGAAEQLITKGFPPELLGFVVFKISNKSYHLAKGNDVIDFVFKMLNLTEC